MITLTGTGDTANAVNNVNIAKNLLTALTFSISGVGSGTFTDSIQAASNHNVPSGGFGDNTNNSGVLFTENSVFSTYNLTTSIGPVSGMADFSPGTNFPTTAGALDIAFVFGDATFSAVVPSSVTPLPAALPLFATGIGGLGLLGWRRKRKSRAGVA